jgi:hypothetical protein
MWKVLLGTIAVVACGKDDVGSSRREEATASTTPSSKPTSPSATETTAAAANQNPACASLFPKPLVDKYLAGFTLDESHMAGSLICQFTKSPGTLLTAAFTCDRERYEKMAEEMATLTKSPLVTRVEGIGKGAFSNREGALTFYATNVQCTVAIVAAPRAPVAKDVNAFAKELDAALVPGSLTASTAPASPKPTSPPVTETRAAANQKPTCAKLFPKPLVDKYLAGFTLDENHMAGSVACEFTKSPGTSLTAVVTCDRERYERMAETIATLTASPPMTKVEGIGKGAYSDGESSLTFYATNVQCTVAFVAPPRVVTQGVNAFAKELDAALVPASLQ